MIADDEQNMRLTLADILEAEGYEVATAATGEQAVTMSRTTPFDVVLMDVRMPGLDGIEAFRQLRRHRADARVILMSAYTTDELKHTVLDEGALAFLSKPLDIESVLRLIGEARDETVLVVEEDEGATAELERSLRERGYRVKIVHTPREALELVEQIHFNVIFLEAHLAAMDGLSLYLAIRKIASRSVVIMMTRMKPEDDEIAQEAVRRTAYTVVRKPLDHEETAEMLDRLTGARMSGRSRKPGKG